MKRHDPNRRALLSAGAASLLIPGSARAQTAPAAGAPFIGLFTDAPRAAIPPQAMAVQTAGHGAPGRGSARYIFDPAVDRGFVAANPRTAFVSSGGRGFRLAHDQEITPFMFGAAGVTGFHLLTTDFAAIPDDSAALEAFLAFCTVNDLVSVNWGGTFGVSRNLVLGNIAGDSQESFAGSETYRGALVLAVKANIDGAVLTIRNRRLCSYESLTVAGPNRQDRTWSARRFDVGVHIEDQAQMQVFTTLSVHHARLCGVYNSGRGSSGDNVFQNRILNAYFSLCGSGLGTGLDAPQGFQSAAYSGRSDSGGPTDPGQRTRLRVSALPPPVVERFAVDGLPFLPMFAILGAELHEVTAIDRAGSTVSLYPWVDRNAPGTGNIRFVYGGGMLTVDGDAGMLDAKVASTACAIGIQNLATYGGTFQLTAQHNAVGFALGKSRGHVSIGGVLNLYSEGNDFDFVCNSIGTFTLAAEQGLDVSKIVFFNPRRGDNRLAEHFKPAGLLMNIAGAWHSTEMAEDVDGGLYSAAIDFTQPASRVVPLRGDNATVRIVDTPLADGKTPAAPHFKRLFGYRARQVDVTGTGPGGRPTGTITVAPYEGLRINGGTPGAAATFSGFTGPVRMRLELDPAAEGNLLATFLSGR